MVGLMPNFLGNVEEFFPVVQQALEGFQIVGENYKQEIHSTVLIVEFLKM